MKYSSWLVFLGFVILLLAVVLAIIFATNNCMKLRRQEETTPCCGALLYGKGKKPSVHKPVVIQPHHNNNNSSRVSHDETAAPSVAPKTTAVSNGDYSFWMSAMSDGWKSTMALKNMVIPGSHDTASSCVPSKQCPNPSGKLAWLANFGNMVATCSTQNLTLQEQIMSGCRYFDVRINYVKGNWSVVHGLCTFNLAVDSWLSENLADIASNIKDELLVFYISFDGNGDMWSAADGRRLVSSIMQAFPAGCFPILNSETDLANATYNQLRDARSNKNNGPTTVLMLPSDIYDIDKLPGTYSNSLVNTNWDPKATNTAAVETYFFNSTPIAQQSSGGLNVLQAFIQQPRNAFHNVGYNIIETENKWRVKNWLADCISAMWPEFGEQKTRWLNIFEVNVFDSSIMKQIIEWNESLANGGRPTFDPKAYMCMQIPPSQF